jgi:hypothetical protein
LNYARFTIAEYGRPIVSEVHAKLKELCLQKIEAIQLESDTAKQILAHVRKHDPNRV